MQRAVAGVLELIERRELVGHVGEVLRPVPMFVLLDDRPQAQVRK